MIAPTSSLEPGSSSDLNATLSQLHEAYTQRNPQSQALYDAKQSHLPGANTRATIHAMPFPLTMSRGESCKLFDVDGHEYLDFLGEFSAGVYGHSCQQVKEAIMKAMDDGWNFGATNKYEGQLAKTLVERFSHSMDLIRFCNSGTEANLMAIGAALNFTRKEKIMVFLHGYHGSTLVFMEAQPKYSLNARYDFVIAPYNDIPGTKAIIAGLPPNSLAAIVVEPMQVSGGCIPGDPDFLHYLREATIEEEALLIFDEVMTSRLEYGGRQVQLGIRPDLTTIGKWAGGGMSFGAFGGRREIMDLFDPRAQKLSHGGTFNNNVVTMAAGVAGCALMTRPALTRLNVLGDKLRAEIAHLIESRLPTSNGSVPKIYVIGLGSLFALRFTGPESAMLSALLYHHFLARGIYIACRGFIALTLEIKEEHFASMLDAVGSFIDLYAQFLI